MRRLEVATQTIIQITYLHRREQTSMLDFSLTDEQLSAATMVRDWAEREIYPTIRDYDRRQEMKPNTLERMGELGILGINIPVPYGGQGYDYVTLVWSARLERCGHHAARRHVGAHGAKAAGLLRWEARSRNSASSYPRQGRKMPRSA